MTICEAMRNKIKALTESEFNRLLCGDRLGGRQKILLVYFRYF